MNVLGLNITHNASAAMVVDGRLVAAAEEERFIREKHTSLPPVQAAGFCLAYAGIEPRDVDYVAVGGDFPNGFTSTAYLIRKILFGHYPPSLLMDRARVLKRNLLKTPARLKPAHAPLCSVYFGRKVDAALEKNKVAAPVKAIPHHLSHGMWASIPTGWKRGACLTVDLSGENDATTAWVREKDSLSFLRNELGSNSLGLVYQQFTEYLGFEALQEGKTMGLAGYGPAKAVEDRVLDRIIQVPGRGSPWYRSMLPPQKSLWQLEEFGTRHFGYLQRVFGAARRVPAAEATAQPYPYAAAACQRALERALLNTIRWLLDKTGEKKLCLGGGVAMNCSANGKIWDSGLVDELYVQPAPMDQGTAPGAALELARQLGEKPFVEPNRGDWGPECSDEETEEALKAAGLEYEYCGGESIAGKTAGLVAGGKIVGWVQGRMEFGARALGHRSILANPCVKGMNDRVNQVKNRERWRPLAPSIARKALGEYVENPMHSPFMLIAFRATQAARREIPAVIHVDNTTRAQSVDPLAEPRYHRLLKEVEKGTGHPVVLNTSFNDAGEPIVCTPQDAIAAYLGMGLDALAIGNYLVTGRKRTSRFP